MSEAPRRTPSLNLAWWAICLAVVLVLLSTITKLTLGRFELSGGATLAAVAALIILWPLLKELASRGGSAELLGIKLQINQLERRTEESVEIRLEELSADIEEIRSRVMPRAAVVLSPGSGPATHADDHDFRAAVSQFRSHRDVRDWRERVKVDKSLISRGRTLPAKDIDRLLLESPEDPETQMAAAVSLGQPYSPDDGDDAIRILLLLLRSPHDRVRHRAARSIERRARRSDILWQQCQALRQAIVEAIRTETREEVLPAFKEALSTIEGRACGARDS